MHFSMNEYACVVDFVCPVITQRQRTHAIGKLFFGPGLQISLYHVKVLVTQAAEMMDIGEVLDSITPATKKYAPARPGHGETPPPSKSFRQVSDLHAAPNKCSRLSGASAGIAPVVIFFGSLALPAACCAS